MMKISYKKGVDLDEVSMPWVIGIFGCLSLLTLSPEFKLDSLHLVVAQLVILAGGLGLFCVRKYALSSDVSQWIICAVCAYCIPITLVYNYDLSIYNEMKFANLCIGLGFAFVLLDWRVALALTAGGSYLSWMVIHIFFPDATQPGFLPDGVIGTLFTVLISSATLSAFLSSLLQSRNKRAKQSVGVLAHEMRTPLSAIGMMAKALGDETPAGSHPNHIAKKIDEIVESMQVRLDMQRNNVRGLNKKERLQADFLPLNLSISNAVKRYFVDRPHLYSTVITSHEDSALVYFNADLFQSLIHNLLSNAVKAVERKKQGGDIATGDIVITSRLNGEFALIEVEDKGDGIDESLHNKIFDEFFSLSGVPANGLGLTMVRSNVEAVGGFVSVRSEPGSGSVFTVKIPGRKA